MIRKHYRFNRRMTKAVTSAFIEPADTLDDLIDFDLFHYLFDRIFDHQNSELRGGLDKNLYDVLKVNRIHPKIIADRVDKSLLESHIDLYYQAMNIDRSNRSRKKEVLQSRAALSVILCRNGFSQESVAPIIGRDRSTIHHYIKNFERDYKMWGGYKERVILCEQVVERLFK